MFRTSGGRSGSFGAIFLTKRSGVTNLKHERGHNWQLMMMGIANYGLAVGVPSAAMLGPWASQGGDHYYRAPWEITADLLGGVSRKVHKKSDVNNGWLYLTSAILYFPACYFFY